MMRTLLALLIGLLLGTAAVAGAWYVSVIKAEVVAVGRDLDTGQTVLVLRFKPDAWRRFAQVYHPRTGRPLALPAEPKSCW